MVYEAERLIERRFGRARARRRIIVTSSVGAVIFGIALTLAVVLLIRKI